LVQASGCQRMERIPGTPIFITYKTASFSHQSSIADEESVLE
jgi:hypothetical protein